MQKLKKIHIFSFLGLTLGESQHITPKLAALQRARLSDIEKSASSFMKMGVSHVGSDV